MKVGMIVLNGADGMKRIEGDGFDMSHLGRATRRRASHIVPLNRAKRALFRLLRIAFGERGHVADWTRRWRGPWRCTIIATGETYISTMRWRCIEWEHGRILDILRSTNRI